VLLDGYVRVSRVGGRSGENFISPEVQREQIEAWARSRSVELATIHVDLDRPGGSLERPGLARALQRVRSGESQGIAVARLDRLSRAGVADALRLVEELHDAGGQLVVVDLGIDPTTAVGELSMTIMLAFARMERRRIADSWQIAKQRAVARGVHFQAPFGYRKREDGRLEPGDHAGLVRDVFRRRARGASWSELVRYLDAHAPPTRARQWTHGSVGKLLRNRAYLGAAFNGEHVQEGAHEALVSPAEFAAAEAVRSLMPARGEGSLLAGLLRCAACRYRMTINHGAKGSPRRSYRCRTNHGSGRCPAPTQVRAHLLEPLVERLFLERYSDVEVEVSQSNDELERARARTDSAAAELDGFTRDTRLREALGHERYVAAVQLRVDELAGAQAALEAARRNSLAVVLPDGDVWDELELAERRALLAAGIDTAFLRRTPGPLESRLLILWRGQAPANLPGRSAPLVEIIGFDW